MDPRKFVFIGLAQPASETPLVRYVPGRLRKDRRTIRPQKLRDRRRSIVEESPARVGTSVGSVIRVLLVVLVLIEVVQAYHCLDSASRRRREPQLLGPLLVIDSLPR